MTRICLQGFVSGKVQGVGFRQGTQVEAERLGLDGWVRNLDDGRVEVRVEGDQSSVKRLVAWLERGPPHARVDDLQLVERTPDGARGFFIAY
ncbi:acylphosphatase [Pseudomonas sp. RIT-PI-AD]|uniref:acylphosphatase n=1 Tax=Pseudomonas sp. RIT-PI-AD TaxID=3035294 RepID=UPI0021DB0A76|nr:acylphosphatase [Pseudomonas sp. RIT-PI-AD]